MASGTAGLRKTNKLSIEPVSRLHLFANPKGNQLSLGKATQPAGLNRLLFMILRTAQRIAAFDYDDSVPAGDLEGIARW